tara:strand:- start:11089 stop:13689 length:2601 start_codon:yes stop_codon:yes gene_type:complete
MEKSAVKKNFLPITLLILFFLKGSLLLCQETPVVESEIPKLVYPKYRRWMSPDNAEVVRFNSPSLQWPSKKFQKFDVRLSRDSLFKESLFQIKEIPFSMINIHKSLAAGEWYWQYKVSGKEWSDFASFTVNDSSIDFAPAGIEILIKSIPKTHPRVMLKKDDWSALMIKVMPYKERYHILERANNLIGKRIPSERDALIKFEGRDKQETDKIKKNFSKEVGYEFGKSLQTLTQAYALTKEKKYFDTALLWMREATSWNPEGLTRINDFGDSYIMESLALAVDVFWEELDIIERKAILEQVAARANGFYKKWTNYLENRNSSMHVWQHILHRMFLTSLATIDEIPEAEKWLTYIYELWLAQHPKMAEEDGAWFNGTGYMRMNVMTLLDIPLKLGAYTGQNFFRTPWYSNFMKWLFYAYPPGATSDGFCNDGKKWPMPNLEYGAFADAYARITGDPVALQYSKAVFSKLDALEEPLVDLDYTGGPLEKAVLSDDQDYAWFRITEGYDMPLPSMDENIKLSDAAFFPDVGVAYFNSNRKNIENNLRVSIKSSPMGPLAHTHAEHNTFNIAYKGKRLFYNSGYRPWMGAPHTLAWYKHTQGHNGILVDQHGQPYDSGAYGFIPKFIEGNQLIYAVGDASHAYQAHELSPKARKDNIPNDMGVKHFRRHYLLLKPNIIVVYDEMEAHKPVDWSWLIHNYQGLKINDEDQTVETTYEDRGGKVSLYGSTPLDREVTNQFSVAPKNFLRKKDGRGNLLTYKNHWHFKATTQKKQDKMRYLAIIQVSDDLKYKEIFQIEDSDVFEIEGWKISAQMDTNKSAKISIERKDGKLKFLSHTGKLDKFYRLTENVNGKTVVKTAQDHYPKSIINAAKR